MMFLNGYKVIVVPPTRTYTRIPKQTKSKVGRRWVQVRRLLEVRELLANDKVLVHEGDRTIMMNAYTHAQLIKEIRAGEWEGVI